MEPTTGDGGGRTTRPYLDARIWPTAGELTPLGGEHLAALLVRAHLDKKSALVGQQLDYHGVSRLPANWTQDDCAEVAYLLENVLHIQVEDVQPEAPWFHPAVAQ